MDNCQYILLTKNHCQDLINRISARVMHWIARALSYVGRLQLINYVLLRKHGYWSSIFLLPKVQWRILTLSLEGPKSLIVKYTK